jgi:predicted metal-dependent hydrolase
VSKGSPTLFSTVIPPSFDRPEIEVRTSARRKKTGAAHWSGDNIVVVLPERVRGKERQRLIDELVNQLLNQRPHAVSGDAALEERAVVLADLYVDGVRPARVTWSAAQTRVWATCAPATREIRLSTSLRPCPEWVVDAVLVHELAHLIEADHTAAFWDIARRHPRQDESETFLAGYALGMGRRVSSADVGD